MTRIVLIAFLSTLFFQSYSQDRYMVFFTDKDDTPFNIGNPKAFLSQRALARRSKQNISIQENDLPVNPNYIAQIEALGIRTYFQTKWMNGVLVQMDENQKSQVEELSFVLDTEFVAPNAPLTILPSTVSEDPVNPENNLAFPQTSLLGIDDMHRDGFRGEGMLIAIFDDGFQNISTIPYFQHLFTEDRIAYTFDYVRGRETVENGFHHGLRSISTIAAIGDDYLGTAPGATFILANTEDPPTEYRIEEYNWLFAAEQADSAGVDIISTSLGYSNGFTDASMDYTVEQMDGETAVISKAANLAASKGIALVSSAGNQGNSFWRIMTAPADSEQVVAVGATNINGELASFSSEGPTANNVIKPDVVAVGRFTSLINVSGNTTFQSGTSFSAPQVVGLAAGLWQAFPNLTNTELLELIRRSGNIAQDPNNRFGYGFPNWNRAVEIINTNNEDAKLSFSVFPNPLNGDFLNLSINEDNTGNIIDIQVLDSNGNKLQGFSKRAFGSVPPLRISTAGLPSGVYIIRLLNAEGSASQKIIKY